MGFKSPLSRGQDTIFKAAVTKQLLIIPTMPHSHLSSSSSSMSCATGSPTSILPHPQFSDGTSPLIKDSAELRTKKLT
jgi:hypothetical protein